MYIMKLCKKCKVNKPLDNFNKNKNTNDGLNNWCKNCSSIKNKERYENKNKEIKEKSSQYYNLNKENILSKLKIYRGQDEIKEKQKSYIKEWVDNNRDHYRYYQNNYAKQRRKNDYRFKTIEILKNQINQFLQKGKKNEKTKILLGYSHEKFIENVGLLTEHQDLDHKIPISWFKPETPINVIWDLRNLQITTREYNRKKNNLYSDIIDKEYYQIIIEWIKPTRLSMISTYL